MNAPIIQTRPFEIIIIPEPVVQVRVKTHRKKRIDKKWRKKYGWKTILAKSDPTKIYFDESRRIVYCYAWQAAALRRQIMEACTL